MMPGSLRRFGFLSRGKVPINGEVRVVIAIDYHTAISRARKQDAVRSPVVRTLHRLGLSGLNTAESGSLRQAFVAYNYHIQGGMVLARLALGETSPCHGIRMGATLCTFRL
jgi:hypothetical protein